MALAASLKDPVRGRDAFDKRCTGCHALDKIKVGPPLRGVYGRTAGKDPQFDVLGRSESRTGRVWDEATLDRWLTDTDSVIPGNDMAFRLNDRRPTGRTSSPTCGSCSASEEATVIKKTSHCRRRGRYRRRGRLAASSIRESRRFLAPISPSSSDARIDPATLAIAPASLPELPLATNRVALVQPHRARILADRP